MLFWTCFISLAVIHQSQGESGFSFQRNHRVPFNRDCNGDHFVIFLVIQTVNESLVHVVDSISVSWKHGKILGKKFEGEILGKTIFLYDFCILLVMTKVVSKLSIS